MVTDVFQVLLLHPEQCLTSMIGSATSIRVMFVCRFVGGSYVSAGKHVVGLESKNDLLWSSLILAHQDVSFQIPAMRPFLRGRSR